MTPSSPGWTTVARLDAERMVNALRGQGVRLSVEGPCPGGHVGAAYVRWEEDGRRGVLKWRPRSSVGEARTGALAVVEALREVGYPAPATDLVTQVGDAVVTVQEVLPGTGVDRLTPAHLDQLLRLNETQADCLTGRPHVPAAALHLRDDGPGFCLHEPLRRHSPRTAALERRISALADRYPPFLLGNDAVHYDFHPGNLLATGPDITGVIDWDGAARGDRRFDLVTLRFGLHAANASPFVTDRLDTVLATLPDHVLTPAWAHMSLRLTDWTIRHPTPTGPTPWLTLADRYLP
ncbi:MULTISPECIES: phosphotransferase [unclassified Streptomyces]|uniref:phosphotransferase n=1 Tax=unclassified Streptomyces TaxID=2593676 RepID=UPI000B847B43|nr:MULTISPECIES: phosphotransferase [unclassified Streptomyces]MYR25275.1 phosphotransferase [Streptomyces sp. SID4945]